jgi:hypothetical protein
MTDFTGVPGDISSSRFLQHWREEIARVHPSWLTEYPAVTVFRGTVVAIHREIGNEATSDPSTSLVCDVINGDNAPEPGPFTSLHQHVLTRFRGWRVWVLVERLPSDPASLSRLVRALPAVASTFGETDGVAWWTRRTLAPDKPPTLVKWQEEIEAWEPDWLVEQPEFTSFLGEAYADANDYEAESGVHNGLGWPDRGPDTFLEMLLRRFHNDFVRIVVLRDNSLGPANHVISE